MYSLIVDISPLESFIHHRTGVVVSGVKPYLLLSYYRWVLLKLDFWEHENLSDL